MVRFIRALLYGAFAAFAATLFLDWLDRDLNGANKAGELSTSSDADESIDRIGDEAKQALLDELAAQV